MNQYDPNKIISPGNITGTTASSMETLAEAGKTYAPYSIGNAIRPNNIGLGTWNAYIQAESAMAVSKLDSVAKLAKGVGYSAVGVDVVSGIYDNVQEGAQTNKIVLDAAVDTAFGLGGLGASVGAGAILGSVIPGAGTLVGAGLGLGVGLIYMGVTEIWQPYGTSIKDRTKEGLYNLIR